MRAFIRLGLASAALGALVGAMAACGLFWLVDFTRVPSDLWVLSSLAVLHGIGLASLSAAVVATALTVLGRLGRRPLGRERVALHAFAALVAGLTFLVVAGAWIVARRPTHVDSLATLLPILAAAATATWIAVRAPRWMQGRAWKAWPFVAVLLASFLLPPNLGLLRASPPADSSGEAVTVAPQRPPPLLLVGWDAATWDVMDPMLAAGKLPNLARLLREGARGRLFATPIPLQPLADSSSAGARSPALWETIATGKMPREHGVWDFQVKLVGGVRQPLPFALAGSYMGANRVTTSEASHAKRVWNILEEHGYRTAVVGWMSTWPIRSGDQGIVVSDLAAFGEPDSIQPTDLLSRDDLRSRARNEARRRYPDLARLVDAKADGKSPGRGREHLAFTLLREYQSDLFKAHAAVQVAERYRPDLLAVVFRGVDVAQHKSWRYFEPELFGGETAEDIRSFGPMIPDAYALLDEQLGRLREAMGEDAAVFLISDHGAGPWRGGPIAETLRLGTYSDYSGNHRMDGIFVLAGNGFRPGATVSSGHGRDVTPTVLHYFGLPVGADMAGQVLEQAWIEPSPVRFTAGYGAPLAEPIRPAEASTEDELVEQLRSLGYAD
jgi:predicted AlkP superfamily phosphohydrolase/phosphomutase